MQHGGVMWIVLFFWHENLPPSCSPWTYLEVHLFVPCLSNLQPLWVTSRVLNLELPSHRLILLSLEDTKNSAITTCTVAAHLNKVQKCSAKGVSRPEPTGSQVVQILSLLEWKNIVTDWTGHRYMEKELNTCCVLMINNKKQFGCHVPSTPFRASLSCTPFSHAHSLLGCDVTECNLTFDIPTKILCTIVCPLYAPFCVQPMHGVHRWHAKEAREGACEGGSTFWWRWGSDWIFLVSFGSRMSASSNLGDLEIWDQVGQIAFWWKKTDSSILVGCLNRGINFWFVKISTWI